MTYDVLVIGSGAAGLSAALRAAELGARVGVLTAGPLLAGSSPRAQGGVAAAVGADDAPALHAADTVSVGAGLNDSSAVAVLTREAGHSIEELGPIFESDLGLEAGHARRRILHAGGGATGQVLTRALLARAEKSPRITLFAYSPVTSLALEPATPLALEPFRSLAPEPVTSPALEPATSPALEPATSPALEPVMSLAFEPVTPPALEAGRVTGARVGQHHFRSGATILATGGYAALWGRSTNAPESRGTGLSLAWQVGASLADLEFVQFHPTALSLPGRQAFLLSEALRGEGARLVDERDQDVVDPLMPRDVVARALHRHLRDGGPVFLSLQHLDPAHVYDRFGRLSQTLREDFGLDLARDRLPVAPAAHYCMGGIRTDTWGRTDVPSLYAAGEVACSGVQGANRLASNSLLECLVFGARAAEAALSDSSKAVATWHTSPLPRSDAVEPPRSVIPTMEQSALGERLDEDLGVERRSEKLDRLIQQLPSPEAAVSDDLRLASLIARAALLRRESRGAHFRVDAPESDPAWRGRIHWRRGHEPVFEEVLSAP